MNRSSSDNAFRRPGGACRKLAARIVLGGALLISLASPAMAQPSEGPAPARVRVDAARLEMVEPRRAVTGEIRATRRALVASEEEGLVLSIEVEEGDRVEAGEALARLDAQLLDIEMRRVDAQIKLREGRLREEQVELERSRRDLERIRELRERGSASKTELDDAISDVSAVEARVQQTEAELDSVRAELAAISKRIGDMTIRAPFAGSVVARSVERGEWVQAGEPVVELVAFDVVEAWIDVPQQFIKAITGQDRLIDIEVEAVGETFSAPVYRIVPSADRLSRMFPVLVRLKNEDGPLRPGMSVTGFAPTGGREEMLTVHKDAILRDEAGAFVYTDADGVARVVRITPLFASGDRVVVRGRILTEGAALVIEGNERLFPGQPLQIVNAQAAGGAAGAMQGGG